MAKEKKIHGIMDLVTLKDDEVAVYPKISPEYLPGMGSGTTPEATRWAYRGYLSELYESPEYLEAIKRLENQKTKNAKTGGAPVKTEVLKLDNQRAFLLWTMFKDFPKNYRLELTSKKAIELAMDDPKLKGKSKKVWKSRSTESLEQSVSRGKSFWGINSDWTSRRLEEFYPELVSKK
jgi:hypothetical protein